MYRTILELLAGLPGLDRMVTAASARSDGRSIFDRCLRTAGLGFFVRDDERRRIPVEGPVVVVANHPTGFAEGLALPALLDTLRTDVHVIAHATFSRWPRLAERMILVDPQARGAGRRINAAGFRRAAEVLREGGLVVLFPAGIVAADGEAEWRAGFVRMARASGATVVPVHVSGRSGRLHRLLTRIHPRLGVLALARELARRRGDTLQFRVGTPLTPDELATDEPPAVVARAIRGRVLAAAGHEEGRRTEGSGVLPPRDVTSAAPSS